MRAMPATPKRILTDIAGYGLILLGILLGWLPGPGGIPLILAGLGLLSINNLWARRLRDYLLKHGGRIVEILFPPNRWVEWLYDGVTVVLLVVVAWLGFTHSKAWQMGIASALFFLALFIALMNRDRLHRRGRKT